MILRSIKFTEFEGKPNEWHLQECLFQTINLIVGKNAAGKSKTLNVINSLAMLWARQRELGFKSGNYTVKFDKNDKEIEYILRYEDQKVLEERLSIGSEIVLNRGLDGKGTIKAVDANIANMNFQTPENQLAGVAKRDAIQHPFLEDLHNWAENQRHFRFGGQLGKEHYASFLKEQSEEKLDLKNTDLVVAIFRDGRLKFGDEFHNIILEDMAFIGYEIDSIDIGPPITITFHGLIPSQPVGLIVKERDLTGKTDQNIISQGMFRALSLITQLNYNIMSSLTSCILVDDIGEGLDYERSTKIIKLLTKKAKETGFQLIMATNDRFVMNNVPLEYWSIVHREGNRSVFLNYINSRELFDKFELTGLNNFDFFSSNYFLNASEERCEE